MSLKASAASTASTIGAGVGAGQPQLQSQGREREMKQSASKKRRTSCTSVSANGSDTEDAASPEGTFRASSATVPMMKTGRVKKGRHEKKRQQHEKEQPFVPKHPDDHPPDDPRPFGSRAPHHWPSLTGHDYVLGKSVPQDEWRAGLTDEEPN